MYIERIVEHLLDKACESSRPEEERKDYRLAAALVDLQRSVNQMAREVAHSRPQRKRIQAMKRFIRDLLMDFTVVLLPTLLAVTIIAAWLDR